MKSKRFIFNGADKESNYMSLLQMIGEWNPQDTFDYFSIDYLCNGFDMLENVSIRSFDWNDLYKACCQSAITDYEMAIEKLFKKNPQSAKMRWIENELGSYVDELNYLDSSYSEKLFSYGANGVLDSWLNFEIENDDRDRLTVAVLDDLSANLTTLEDNTPLDIDELTLNYRKHYNDVGFDACIGELFAKGKISADELKVIYQKGDRVSLIEMEGEKQMAKGLSGTIDFIDDAGQIHVSWENGSSLALVPSKDKFEVVDQSLVLEYDEIAKEVNTIKTDDLGSDKGKDLDL